MRTIKTPKETKAKQKHQCDFCAGRILPGDKYIKSTYVFEGEVYDWKEHGYCSKLATDLNMYDDYPDGLTQDAFMEIVHDRHDEILINLIPEKDVKKYADIIRQLRCVNFRDKLGFVIRSLKNTEKCEIQHSKGSKTDDLPFND